MVLGDERAPGAYEPKHLSTLKHRRVLMTDRRWTASLIGGMETRAIEIHGYDPRWPERYKQHAAIIAEALGEAALSIEHIGSTAVPGLAAKPIVDILLVVHDSANEASYLPRLEQAGYMLRVREPEFYEHRMLRTPERDVHIHVFSPDSPEIERYLTFRNRLRTNAEERRLYQETKRQLASKSWPDMDAYANAKTETIERIIAAARTTRDPHQATRRCVD